jgi:hypothetical protein
MDYGPVDSALGVAYKRTAEMCDRGPSWMLQLFHASDADANVMLRGR